MVLEHGANVGVEDDECGTPLYAAADYGRLEVVRVLIERGESIGTERQQGQSAIPDCVGEGKGRVYESLSERGKPEVVLVCLNVTVSQLR